MAAAVEGPVSASCPASVLQLHPHATVLLDQAAAARLGPPRLLPRGVRGQAGLAGPVARRYACEPASSTPPLPADPLRNHHARPARPRRRNWLTDRSRSSTSRPRCTRARPSSPLPPEFGQTATFELEEISRYDDRGPAWYWNNFRTGEHTGTHFDAPNHWVTGQRLDDVASVPAARLIGPAVVLDSARRRPPTRTSCSRSTDITAWEAEHGALPGG